jgi:hypothetical protein
LRKPFTDAAIFSAIKVAAATQSLLARATSSFWAINLSRLERPTCETGLEEAGGVQSGSIATVMITRFGCLASVLVFAANPLPLVFHDAAMSRAPHRTKTINSLPIILLSHRNQGTGEQPLVWRMDHSRQQKWRKVRKTLTL